MSVALDLVSAALMVTGCLFALVASVGLIRLSDTYLRIHVATKPATLSIALVGAGAILQMPGLEARTQLVLAIIFQFWTAPVSSHMLGRAIGGRAPEPGDDAKEATT